MATRISRSATSLPNEVSRRETPPVVRTLTEGFATAGTRPFIVDPPGPGRAGGIADQYKVGNQTPGEARTVRPIRTRPQEPSKPPEEPTRVDPPTGCPDPNTLILLSDGSQKRAGDLRVGDVVRTQHEDTLEWGEHKVTYVHIKESEKLILTFDHTEFVCSTTHKFYVEGKGWIEVTQMEIGDFVVGVDKSYELLEVKEGTYGDVVVIQIEDAHTYISEGLLSHNKTILKPPLGGGGGGTGPTPAPEPGVDPIPPTVPPNPTGTPGTFIPGVPTTTTTTQSVTATRTGTSTRIITTPTNKTVGNKLLSLDVLPYMRSRNIEFIAKKLKPNTLLYPFFDKQNVYDYIVPKILEIEMISGSFVAGETVSGVFIQTGLVNLNSTSTETSIQFRLANYNHKYGPYNNPTDVFSSSPYNIAQQLQPYSPTSTTLNVDTTSLSDLSLGTYGGNVFIGMNLVGRQSGARAVVKERRLVSDNVGTVIGSFFIPNPNRQGNPRFSTGNKTFRLTDNPTNGTIAGTLYTYANANFFADGLITQSQETILSIRNIETQTVLVNETTTTENTTITTTPGQPVFVPGLPPPPAPIPPAPSPPPQPPAGGPGPGPEIPPPPAPIPPGPTPQPPGPTPQPPGPTPRPRTPAPTPPTPTPGAFSILYNISSGNDQAVAGTLVNYYDKNGDGIFTQDEIEVFINVVPAQLATQSRPGNFFGDLFPPGVNPTVVLQPGGVQARIVLGNFSEVSNLAEDVEKQRQEILRDNPYINQDQLQQDLDDYLRRIAFAYEVDINSDAYQLALGVLNEILQEPLNRISAVTEIITSDRPGGLPGRQIPGLSTPTLQYDSEGRPFNPTLEPNRDALNNAPGIFGAVPSNDNQFPTRGLPQGPLGFPATSTPSLPGRSPASQPPGRVPTTSRTPITRETALPSRTATTRPGTATPTAPTVVATTPSVLATGNGPSSLPPRVPSAPTQVAQPVAIPRQQAQPRVVVDSPAPSPVNSRIASATNVPVQSAQQVSSSAGANLSRYRSGCTGRDPLAQTFKIGSDEDQIGRYITSVDLFFYSKAPELPVYVELRSVELGTPTQKIYPFSKVELLPQNINISADGTLATRVTFQAPVYLEGNKEHALVLLSDSIDYSVFVSRLGEVDITTALLPESQQRLVTTQPTLGSLFKSQNASTWTPSQYEDLKFNLYAAVFESTGSVSFFNPELNRSNDQIAILRNNALDIESRRVRVGLGTTLSVATIADLTEGSFVRQRDTNAIGDFAYVTGAATGTLSIPNSGIGYTPSIGTQTYSNVTLRSISGFGRAATATITVTNGVITAAGISSGGTGYQVGEVLTADAIGITSIGRNLRLSVRQLSAFNELVVDNVQGEFQVGVAKSIQYFSALTGVGYTDLNGGSVFANNINVERDGLYINVKHRNHGMHALTNVVSISNAISDITPVKLTNDLERSFTGNIVVTGLTTEFNTFENVGISSTNPGYLVVNSEIISYTGVDGNAFTGIARGVDSTLQITHPANSFIYKYELAGVSLRRINTTHTLQDVTDSTKENTLDSYYIKINPSSNGVDRSTGISLPKLYSNSTKSTGGPIIEATQNIPYDIAQPIVQTFTPPQTTITALLRTISGTSIDGSEESFLDRGTQIIKLNEDNFFDNPRMIASRVNERLFLNNILGGNKSLQMSLNLSTTNQYLSPVIDLDRVGMILVSNRVNEPVTNYVADDRVSLIQTDPNAFVYASKPITLEVPATSIKIIVSAHLNIYNDLRAMFAIMKDENETPFYYPFPGNGNVSGDGRTINISNNDGRPDLPFKITSKLGFQSTELSFIDYEFTINNLESFKYFSIKLIGSSTSQTYPPRLRDLRIIALA